MTAAARRLKLVGIAVGAVAAAALKAAALGGMGAGMAAAAAIFCKKERKDGRKESWCQGIKRKEIQVS